MKKKLLTILQYMFFVGLGVLFVWLSGRNITSQGWKDINKAFANADYWLLVPVIMILFLSHWLRALRWRILMEPLGYTPSRANTFFAVMIGYLANLGVPRLGEVLKCTLIARYEKVPVNKLVGTMIAERAFDMISLAIVFLIAIITQSDLIWKFIHESVRSRTGDTDVTTLFVLITLAVVTFIIAVWFILKKFSHIAIIHSIHKLLKGIWLGLTSLRYVKHKRKFFIYSISIWVLYYIGTYIGFSALEETKVYGYREALSVLAFGSIGMIMAPGGIGAYQFMIQKTMLLYDLSESIGYAFGWIMWGAQTAVTIIFGFISFGLLPYYNKKIYAKTGQDQ